MIMPDPEGAMPRPVVCRVPSVAAEASAGLARPREARRTGSLAKPATVVSATDGYGIPGIALSSTKLTDPPRSLRCFLGRLTIRVSQGLVHLAGGPQSVQQHGELACNGDDGALLAVLAATLH
jgi:hypothetical protein